MNDQSASYFRRATTWAVDEYASLRATLRYTRIFAGAAITIAVLEAFALLLMTPLKTIRPIPVLVDRQTGYVEVLKDDGRRDVRADTALTQSLLAQYVIGRESFDIAGVGAAYRKVALWSDGPAKQDYLSTMPASNPRSPFRIYPRTTTVDAWIKSVSPIGPNVALVRFETRRHDQDGRTAPPQAWASVVAYRFSNAPMSVEDRLVNPLGFQVVRYHRDAETIRPAEPQESAPLSPAAPQTTVPVLTGAGVNNPSGAAGGVAR